MERWASVRPIATSPFPVIGSIPLGSGSFVAPEARTAKLKRRCFSRSYPSPGVVQWFATHRFAGGELIFLGPSSIQIRE
jgi:hypothetical protein